MPNRVISAIERCKQRITDRIASGQTTQEAVDKLNVTLNMELSEYCRFQQLKSLASLNGKLTLDEAQTIYSYLGESVETFNGQPVHVKSVLTQILAELLESQIGTRNGKAMAG